MEWSLIFNPLWVLFVFVVWVVLVLNAKPLRVISCPSQNINVNRKWIFILFFLVVCVLGLHRWDTYHMPLYWMNDNFTSHFEPFHVWLVENVAHDSILLYRLLVFGTTSVLYLYSAKYLDDFTNNFCFATCLFVVDSMFCEMRGTIGVMTMMLGFILLLNQKKFLGIHTIIAALLLYGSFFMHKSMPFGLALAAIALFKFDRKSIIIGSWIAFPFLIPVVDALLNNVLNGMFDLSFGDEMGLSRSVDDYGNQDRMVSNINGLIADLITNIPLYLSFLYLSIRIGFRQIKMDRTHSYLFRLYYIMTYVGALFSFIETSSWIAIRISVMAIYPLPFLMSRVWSQEENHNKWVTWIVRLAIFACVFNFVYRIYLWSK